MVKENILKFQTYYYVFNVSVVTVNSHYRTLVESMQFKIRLTFVVVFMVMAFSIIRWMNRYVDSMFLTLSNPSSCRIKGTKWVVTTVTSLHPEVVRKLLNIVNWNLMVIGEKETPQSWPEQFSSEKLFYLSFQEQKKLDLHLVQYISYGVNFQKNIGYLVAIFCGAKIIYELDANSFVWDSEITFNPSVQTANEVHWLAFHRTRSPFINIYGIFGQPQIWPRGIPVNELQNISEDGWSSLRHNDNETINAYIQQKLFDFDPDVNAITLLTRPGTAKRTIFEHDRGPIALEPFTFSPYNSQNTVHHQAAFWGLYLPVTVNPHVADIWRSFWVQRLLWDIGGHLVFITSTVRRYESLRATVKDMENEQILHNNAGKFVRFLNSWMSTATSLSERIQELTDALIKAQLLDKLESTVMHAWLHDLNRIGYNFPLLANAVKNTSSTTRIKRAAVCLTGLAECVQEIWARNEVKLRKRLNGDIDIFMFLSAEDGVKKDLSPMIFNMRVKQARFYNTTINIVHHDVLNLNPQFPPTCKYKYDWTQKRKIVPIEQERFAQANCYNIVREYENKRNIRYQLLIRARTDSIFTRLPKTFERDGEFDLNNTIIVPKEHQYYGVNDRFAIGPIDLMEHYMLRWHQLSLCLTENVHPESFLAFVLQKRGIKVTTDIGISLAQVPHGENQCH
jgi:hypothetical protein